MTPEEQRRRDEEERKRKETEEKTRTGGGTKPSREPITKRPGESEEEFSKRRDEEQKKRNEEDAKKREEESKKPRSGAQAPEVAQAAAQAQDKADRQEAMRAAREDVAKSIDPKGVDEEYISTMTNEEKVKWAFRMHSIEAEKRLAEFQAGQFSDPETTMVFKTKFPEGQTIVGPADKEAGWFAQEAQEKIDKERKQRPELRPEDRPGVILPALESPSFQGATTSTDLRPPTGGAKAPESRPSV